MSTKQSWDFIVGIDSIYSRIGQGSGSDGLSDGWWLEKLTIPFYSKQPTKQRTIKALRSLAGRRTQHGMVWWVKYQETISPLPQTSVECHKQYDSRRKQSTSQQRADEENLTVRERDGDVFNEKFSRFFPVKNILCFSNLIT